LQNDARTDKSPIDLLFIIWKKECECGDNAKSDKPAKNRNKIHTTPALRIE
jgi:hypothetical protein